MSSSHRIAQRVLRPATATSPAKTTRLFSTSTLRRFPDEKDSQLQPESTEHSLKGDTAAAQDDTAFDPKVTDPKEQHDQSGSGESNSLDATPANPEMNRTVGLGEKAESSPAQDRGERKMSGGSNPKKASGT